MASANAVVDLPSAGRVDVIASDRGTPCSVAECESGLNGEVSLNHLRLAVEERVSGFDILNLRHRAEQRQAQATFDFGRIVDRLVHLLEQEPTAPR